MGRVVWLKKRYEGPERAEGRSEVPGRCAEIVILPCIRYERPEGRPFPAGAGSTSPHQGKAASHYGASTREPKAV